MPDLERLTDSLRVFSARNAVTREWARGYQAGKTRARYEVLAMIVAVIVTRTFISWLIDF